MPFYEVHHSYPLSDDERQSIARSIADLHCTAFTTPSFLVYVQSVAHDINYWTYHMARKPKTVNSNRIIGVVRTSPSFTKSDFDTLAANIEDAWYKTLNPAGPDGKSHSTETQILLVVTFLPMVTIREGGMAIPEAGQTYFKS
ncbi:Tautomerase-3 domain-containing protein [Fusarium sp. Ph1]|nr:Tautomerase-3 domain-containing protein [Fusarium sp. Ph1]